MGSGAVLSNIMEDGTDRPIAKAGINCSQLETKATALIWSLKMFFQYCYGRKITLVIDNKLLARMLHPQNNKPVTTALILVHYAKIQL